MAIFQSLADFLKNTFVLDSSGTSARIKVGGSDRLLLETSGATRVAGNGLVKSNKSQIGLSATSSQNFILDASAADGTLKLIREDNTVVWTIDAAGVMTVINAVNSNTLGANTVTCNGNISCGGTVYTIGVSATGEIHALGNMSGNIITGSSLRSTGGINADVGTISGAAVRSTGDMSAAGAFNSNTVTANLVYSNGNINAAGLLVSGSSYMSQDGNIIGSAWAIAPNSSLHAYLTLSREYDGFGSNTLISGGGTLPYANGVAYSLSARPGTWLCLGGHNIPASNTWSALFVRIG